MYEFEPGVAYRFTPCMDGLKSFVAVECGEAMPNEGIVDRSEQNGGQS